jgi:DNA-binding beta-propeller fold protein YncE
MNRYALKRCSFILMSFMLLIVNTTIHALPFSVVPKIGNPLPTSLSVGNTASAFYTVTNNTQANRFQNYVKYLPPNVAQVTQGGVYSDTCGATFNLSGKGQSGDSCTLQLTISGGVNGNDPNPHNHLFVCFPRGLTCAGTNSPLNVKPTPAKNLLSITVTPNNASILRRQTQQFIAIGTYDDNTTENITSSVSWSSSDASVAPIAPSGLAKGVGTGSTLITATAGTISSSSSDLTINVFAYITNFGNNTVSVCAVNADSTLGTCNQFSDASFNGPAGIQVNATATLAYVANANINLSTMLYSVSVCPINSNGTLSTCYDSADSTFNSPPSVALNSAGTVAYVANYNGTTVSICPINGNGSLGTCEIPPNSPTFTTPTSVRLNNSGTLAYVVNHLNNNISGCPVNLDSTLSNNCSLSPTTSLHHPVAVALNSDNSFAYLTNSQTYMGQRNVSICPINSDGSIGVCGSYVSGLFAGNNFGKIALNALDTYAYVVNETQNYITLCSISSDGTTFNTCTQLMGPTLTFSSPEGIQIL